MRSDQREGKRRYLTAVRLAIATAAALVLMATSGIAPSAAAAKPHFPVKGIYVNAHVMRSEARMNQLIRLVDRTELNAMVLDVNSGMSLVSVSGNGARTVPSQGKGAQHIRRLVQKLQRHHVYLIARIVTFKNSQIAATHPQWAIHTKTGRVWRDNKGSAWIDPYHVDAWSYPIALAREAARIGFDEVQFDYVRFPENGAKLHAEAAFANPHGWSRQEAVRRFLHRATEDAHRHGVVVSADVFGLVGSTRSDMGIGQTWPAIASEVDVISPMTYPSHYSPGIWGIRNPDLAPTAVISRAVRDAVRQNRLLEARGRPAAQVRPWLQSFTATWIHPHQRYGPKQVRQQIEAASRAGVTSYLLWNSSSRYSLG